LPLVTETARRLGLILEPGERARLSPIVGDPVRRVAVRRGGGRAAGN
jgi:hypothetical protein